MLYIPPLAAQASLSGIVRDDSTARPLEGVEVLVNRTDHRAITGPDGRYRLDGLPTGMYQIIFRSIGHLPLRMDVLLAGGETTRANATLVRSDVVLEPIVVTGEARADVGLAGRGFEERRKMGFGRFYDSNELRELEHLKVGDVIRRKGGVTVMGPPTYQIAMNSYMRNIFGELNCYMSIYLDGLLHWRGGSNKSGEELLTNPPPNLATLVSVHGVAAIEVYRSAAGIPVEFGGTSSQCGAVVIWTRRGP
jgi:hypothetical protein